MRVQDWSGREERHAAHEGHERKGGAERAKEI